MTQYCRALSIIALSTFFASQLALADDWKNGNAVVDQPAQQGAPAQNAANATTSDGKPSNGMNDFEPGSPTTSANSDGSGMTQEQFNNQLIKNEGGSRSPAVPQSWNPKTSSNDTKSSETKSSDGNNNNNNNNNNNGNNGRKVINCENSNTVHSSYDCSSTENTIQSAQTARAIGTAAGAVLVGGNATIQSQNAATAGTMSANVKAASITTNVAGGTTLLQGAMNLFYGSQLLSEKSERDKNAGELNAATDAVKKSGSTVAASGAYGKAGEFLSEKSDENWAEASKVTSAAAGEQNSAARQAKIAATEAFVYGGIQTAQGIMMMNAAKAQRDAANAMSNAEHGGPASFAPGSFGQGDQLAAPGSNGLTGNGFSSQNGSASTDGTTGGNGGGLGDGFNTNAPTGTASATPPNAFASGQGPSGGGGGGGGLSGGGDLSAAAPDNTDTSQKLAEGKSNSGYEGGGGSFAMGGGSRGSGGGPDLSGLLGQLLGKGEDPNQKGGIMDYKNKGRGLASDNYGLLDRNVNIFERVHDHYQAKQKQNFVGI